VTRSLGKSPIPDKAVWKRDDEFVHKLNAAQSLWKAGHNAAVVGRDIKTLQRRAGVPVRIHPRTARAQSVGSAARRTDLPDSWDWRNVSGIDYVGPMRDQLNCGSCYSFAAAGMVEARLRILSGMQQQTLVSPQNPVSCSQYSQGCDGGFPYLVSKFGMDFGHVSDACFPYESGIEANVSCSRRCSDPDLIMVNDFAYVGGFYGGCSEEAMMEEIMNYGPIAIGFEVYDDFMSVRCAASERVVSLCPLTLTCVGAVHERSLRAPAGNRVGQPVGGDEPCWWVERRPFMCAMQCMVMLTRLPVLMIGWGVDTATGTPYWICKNSWGRHFGMGGYFWIRRGTDECGVESLGLWGNPVV
jgi:cathepsin C